MATVPGVPTPQVSQSAAPSPLQDVRPPAEAFGLSAVGQQLTEAGHTADQVSSILSTHAQQFQAINNKVAADASSNNAIDAYGAAELEYKTNFSGLDAAKPENVAAYHAKIAQISQDHAEGLSPDANVEYQSVTRRYYGTAVNSINTYAASQRIKGITDQTERVANDAIDRGAAHPDDPTATANAILSVHDQAALRGTVLGWHDTPDGKMGPEAAEWVKSKLGKMFSDQADNAISAGQGDVATRIRDDNLDMFTADQLKALNRSLAEGRTTSEANSLGMAIRLGTGVLPNNTAPTGKWDAGVATFRTNPEAAFKQFAGVDGTLTSGARSPAHNVAVGGAPNSAHLSNDAWDFTLPSGKPLMGVAQTVLNNLHAANIPVDQVEVDSSNNHIHIGFGAKNRNEIVDQSGIVLQQTAPTHALAVPLIPFDPKNDDPEEYVAKAEPLYTEFVAKAYPNDANQQAKSLSAAMAAVRQKAQLADITQRSLSTNLSNMMEQQQVQDLPGFLAGNPDAQKQYNSLPKKYRDALTTQASHLANERTTSRISSSLELDGLAKLNPQEFAKADLTKYDLTRTDAIAYAKRQDTTRASILKNEADIPNTVKTAMESQAAQAAIKDPSLGMKNWQKSRADAARRNQFAGALNVEFQKIEAQTGKPPTGDEITAAVAAIIAREGQQGFSIAANGNITLPHHAQPAFQVPPNSYAKIKARLLAAKLPADDIAIGAAYRSNPNAR